MWEAPHPHRARARADIRGTVPARVASTAPRRDEENIAMEAAPTYTEERTGLPDQLGGVRLRGAALAGVLASLMLTLLLAALDQTIVGTALPTIIGDLHGF